ncbi:microtubule-associated protein futsch isoform X3 [Senna tora]|uniref:Microtubule-associated protein futsch isoform X3 n=1 Tax=Senna tora TaxID=362788 RepID=A0A834SZB9_9FABA|nr:microtubule-associated protein futsch isoform X3 [Senna tora]
MGLKITRTRDGVDDDDHCGTSISELQIAKDRAGPLFLSKETNAMFILTAHLKGYKRKNIEIKISEDGKEISISGEKPIQEMLMIGWVMMKNQVEILGFKKVFKIPNGVVLDWIKAKYNEDESILKIVMPKVMKRIYGVQIEEVIMGEEYGESSQKDSEVGGNESILEKEQGLSNKKLLEASNGEIIVDTSQRGTKKHRFEIGDGFEAMRNLELGNEEDQHSQKKLKEPINQIQPLKDKDVMLVGEIGGTNAKEIETKYRDEKGKEINKEEEQEKTIQGGEYESFLARQIGVNGEEIVEETKQRETKVPKSIETRDRDGECMVGKEPSMKEEEAIEQIPLGESKKVVGEEMSKEGVAEIGTEMKKKVPKALNLFREHENVSARERENGCSEEDMNREKKQKQFEQPDFKTKDKDIESLVGENICKEGIEEEEIGMKEQVSKAPTLLGESNNVFVRAIGSNGDRDGEGVVEEETCKEGVEEKGTKMNEKVPKASSLSLNMNGETKQKESEKPESETEDKNRENVVREEISKEAIQGTEPEIEEQVSKDPTLLRESRNLFARELIWSNGEDMNREKKQKDIKEPMFETKIRDRESMVDEEIETRMKEQVPKESSLFSGEDMNGVMKQKEIEEPKFEIEDKDGESVVGGEICKEAIEGTELGIEEKVSKAPPLLRESRNTFAREIGSNGEDMNRETKQKENKEPMLETKIRDRESMVDEETCREGVEEIETRMKEEVPKEKQAEEPMFESEDKNKESEVGEEITKEGLKGTKIGMKEQVSKAPVGSSNGETEENKIEDPEFETKHRDRESVVEEETCKEALNGETEQKENEEPKFETKGMDRESNTREEISKEVSEDIKVEMKEQVPKAPNQLGESKIVFAKSLGLSREDFDGETKQKEREEPKCEEKDKDKEWIVEDTGMKGFTENEHSERTIENMEGEEDINGVAKQRETEESEIPKSTKAKVVVMEETKGAEEVTEKVHKKTNDEGSKITQRDYTKEAEQMGTNIAKFPEHMVETKAKREGEVKVKGEVVTKMHDEAKVGVHKDITRERVHMEIGQPKGDNNGKSQVEVKEDNNGKSQVEASCGFKKDNTRETNQEETEEPHVGTKHKDKKCIQEEGALTNIREGPKDTETEKMENGESLMKEEIQEKNVETLCKKEQNTKDLKDQSLEGKGFFKTLIQNRGQQYMLENSDEKGFETKRDSNEEEKVSQKDQAEIVPFKSKGTRIIAESEDEEEPEIHGKTQELKGVEEFKEALDNSEIQNPQKELVLPQMEIQREEGIPFHASEISNSEVAPAKAIDTHSEATRINFGKDAELKGDVDKPSIEKSEVDEKGKIDECCEGSAFLASLIVLFVCHKRVGKRYGVFD